MALKLGMKHWVLRYYIISSNYDPGLTLTCFKLRSNLVVRASVLEKVKIIHFSKTTVTKGLKDGRCIYLNE